MSVDKGFHNGLRMLISQVRQKNLVVEPEASLLIKKYFVASRRARAQGGVKGTDMPLKALQTMTAMAEGTFVEFLASRLRLWQLQKRLFMEGRMFVPSELF